MKNKEILVFLTLLFIVFILANTLFIMDRTNKIIEGQKISGRSIGMIRFCINSPPNLDISICDNVAYTENQYICHVNATDLESEVLNFTSVFVKGQTLFNITSTGLINFTPRIGQEGNYTIHIKVMDDSGCDNNFDIDRLYLEVKSHFCFNNTRPELNLSICNTTWYENSSYICQVEGYDPNPWVSLVYSSTVIQGEPFFNISKDGLLNFTANRSHVGDYEVMIIVDDNLGCDNSVNSGILNFTIYPINHPPYFDGPILNQTWEQDTSLVAFDLDNYFYDIDNDPLTYEHTILNNIRVDIDENNIVRFTPIPGWHGIEFITFLAFDPSGAFAKSNMVMLTVLPEEKILTTRPGGSAGGAGGFSTCIPQWYCYDWEECLPQGYQTRSCVDFNECGTDLHRPNVTQKCLYVATCFDGIQNQGEEGIDCGGPCPPCPTCDDGIKNCHKIIQQDGSWIEVCEEGIDCGGPCPPCPTCDDGIQNCHKIIQEDGSWIEVCEEGIDCGGPCPPCEIKKPAEIPGIIEVDFLIEYPWLLWILIIAIILLTVSEDKAYIKKIMKKEFKQYRKDMLRYIKIRKRIYGLSIFVSCIILIFSLYIFSLQFKKDFTLLYVGGTLVIITGFLLYIYLVKKFKYDEKKKNKEEQIFLETDKRKTENLIKIAEENLLKMELKTGFKIYKILKNGFIGNESEEDESVNEIIKSINNIYRLIRDLVKKRKKTLIPFETDKDTKKLIKKLSNNRLLKSISMKYPEIKEILRCLKKLDRNLSKKETKEKDLVNSINDYISRLTEIAFDKHLIIVIKSDKRIISLYNGLIDIYDNYQKQINEKVEFNKNITDKETDFRRMLEKMTNRGVIIEKIRTTKELKSIYNDFVDLYNNYKRKEDLYNDLKQIELRKREILRS